jgi:hypothetical protein
MNGKEHFQNLDMDGRTYQMDFKERGIRKLTGFISFRMETRGELLLTR